MTPQQIEAMKLALEALEEPKEHIAKHRRLDAITAIKEALAQPEQDYLAVVPPMLPQMRDGETIVVTEYALPEQCQCPACKVTPHASDCAVHNEPAYSKGACNCKAQPEQEPVAWMTSTGALYRTEDVDGCFDVTHTPLYTAPPQPEPVIDKSAAVRIATALGWEPKHTWVELTDDEIKALASWWPSYDQMPALMVLAKDIQNSLREKNT